MVPTSTAVTGRRGGQVIGIGLASNPASSFNHISRRAGIPPAGVNLKQPCFNRNWPVAYAQLGRCKFYTGSIEEMIPLVKRAIRLSPRDGEWANGSSG